MAENHDARSRRQSVIFEEPPSGGFSRAIWLEYANQQTFKGDESGEFPHEVGLFLSYPPEDVKGFIDHRANDFKCAGLWKVYGDEEKVRSLFEKYRKCTEIYCKTSTLMSPTANCSRNVNASSVDKLISVMSAVVYCSTWLWIDSHNGFLSMPRYSNVLPGAFLCK